MRRLAALLANLAMSRPEHRNQHSRHRLASSTVRSSNRKGQFVERVRELRTELLTVEAEVTDLGTHVTPRRKLSAEHVERYMAKLRERIQEQGAFQRSLFQELKPARRSGFAT